MGTEATSGNAEAERFIDVEACQHVEGTEEVEPSQHPPGVMSILCLVMLKRRLWLLPILTSGWLFTSFWTSYAIAVSYNHTEANFPYISHTAIEAPERCVFGQMVNIGAVMLGMNVILRYLFVKKSFLYKVMAADNGWYKVNLAGLVLGILSAFGLSMVANFQTQVQRGPHYFGAGLAFGLGTVYCWVQTCLSYRVCNRSRKLIVALQFLNSVIMSMMLVLFGTTKALYKVKHANGEGTKWGSLRGIYLTSTITEWLLALSILTFTLTYAPDFKHMRVYDPKIFLKPPSQEKSVSRDLNENCGKNITISTNGTKNNLEMTKTSKTSKVEPQMNGDSEHVSKSCSSLHKNNDMIDV